MSPRRNRRAVEGTPIDDEQARRGVQAVQQWADGEWLVRTIPGGASVKVYRCPGCDQEVREGVPHVVVWPVDGRGDETDRRHWHTGCWGARGRRGPTSRRY